MLKTFAFFQAAGTAAGGFDKGKIFGTGGNGSGQLGLGNTTSPITTFTQESLGFEDWELVSSSSGHSLAVRNGQLYATGSNNDGKTGTGADRTVFTVVSGMTGVVSIATSDINSLAVRNNGTLWAAGRDQNGELGLGGGNVSYNTFTQVGSGTNWTFISASQGSSTSMGLRGSGTLWAAGDNTQGRLGLGASVGPFTSFTQVGSNTDWTHVSLGSGFGLGLRANGTIWSWGSNTNGQTAQGTSSGSTLTPTQIGSATGWIKSDGHFIQQLAILGAGAPPPPPPPPSDEGLFTWGNNANGQLGQGDLTQRTSPTKVGNDLDWTDVATGSGSTLSVKGGELFGSGLNTSGELGLGNTTSPITSFTKSGSFTDWLKVDTNSAVSLGIRGNGRLFTWGSNAGGRTGQNLSTGNILNPTEIPAATQGWTHVSIQGSSMAIQDGKFFSCGSNGERGVGGAGNTLVFTQVGSFNDWTVVVSDVQCGFGIRSGQVYSWGLNDSFRTGQNTSTGSTSTPTQMPGTGTGWTSVTGNGAGGAGVRNGQLWAWGANSLGQCGNGTTNQIQVPVQIGSDTDWLEVSGGNGHCFALKKNGTVWGAGSNGLGQLGLGNTTSPITTWTQVGTGSDWYKLTAGEFHSGGLRGTPPWAGAVIGRALGWGVNGNGQLGLNNTTTPISRPTLSAFASTQYTSLSMGQAHTLAIVNGALYSTGLNASSQLGLGDTTQRTQFAQVGSFTDWANVSAGDVHSVGVRNGLLYAWGSNANGRTGFGSASGTTTTPTQVGSAINWLNASAGEFHSHGVRADGTLWAWGSNDFGSTGRGIDTGNTLSPTQVGSATNWVRAEASYFGGMGLRSDGTLWGWGFNASGQVGNGNTSQQNSPVLVSGGFTDWSFFSKGTYHCLAIRGGRLYSWGANAYGELGLGDQTARNVPNQILGFDDWEWCAAGNETSFAIRKGKLYCWGRNPSGDASLGIGVDGENRLTPILISAHETYKFVTANRTAAGRSGFAIRK